MLYSKQCAPSKRPKNSPKLQELAKRPELSSVAFGVPAACMLCSTENPAALQILVSFQKHYIIQEVEHVLHIYEYELSLTMHDNVDNKPV
jgi:hypothetical protein